MPVYNEAKYVNEAIKDVLGHAPQSVTIKPSKPDRHWYAKSRIDPSRNVIIGSDCIKPHIYFNITESNQCRIKNPIFSVDYDHPSNANKGIIVYEFDTLLALGYVIDITTAVERDNKIKEVLS
ncbi:MAG: hypothetical protein WCK10_03915 [Candidatus Staskawiczbacteria bacterium]